MTEYASITPEEVFDFSSLVAAWREVRRFSNTHEDLHDYHERRYRAFAAAFSADLDQPPPSTVPMPAWIVEWHQRQRHNSVPPLDDPVWWGRWPQQMHDFALGAEERARELYGPFDGYLERPPALRPYG